MRALKDSFALVVAGLACSVMSWAFFRYFGQDAWGILATMLFLATAADNRRLRRHIRRMERDAGLPSARLWGREEAPVPPTRSP